ncbi:hypothetical protein [Nocardia farcinica]|uniref:hypothetical protein n=1 Tax=Nocardia farcinica TaxID=37329 RepID=UPI0024541CBB|nr:hypothetical protein [Nocardia farcinica]
MQTLIVLGVVVLVLALVFGVVQFASRPPRDESRYKAAASRATSTMGSRND